MIEKICIPEKYKADLEYRFNPENARQLKSGKYRIWGVCPLCVDYSSDDCEDCPFEKYSGDIAMGCIRWIIGVVKYNLKFQMSIRWVKWEAKDNKKARSQLRKLNREAGKFITWVKEE